MSSPLTKGGRGVLGSMGFDDIQIAPQRTGNFSLQMKPKDGVPPFVRDRPTFNLKAAMILQTPASTLEFALTTPTRRF